MKNLMGATAVAALVYVVCSSMSTAIVSTGFSRGETMAATAVAFFVVYAKLSGTAKRNAPAAGSQPASVENPKKEEAGYTQVNSMPSIQELDEHYSSLSDDELLRLRAEGGFTAEAEKVLDKELALRNLASDDTERPST